MNPELRELYQSVILDHNKQPRNFREPEGTNRTAAGFNPLCGDRITVHLRVEGDIVADIGFQGSGCAISRASASLMTQSIKGKPAAEADRLFEGFHNMVTSRPRSEDSPEELGKLAVFSGVREFPMRVKCATLAWHAMREALHETGERATTE